MSTTHRDDEAHQAGAQTRPTGPQAQPREEPARNPTTEELADADRLIDWELALSTFTAVTSPGPSVSKDQAANGVEDLRQAARRSTGYVAEVTGLQAVPGERVFAVDRLSWAKANLESFRTLLAPSLSTALRHRGRAGTSVARKVTGAELGSVLGFIGTRVLGQYDIAGGPTGVDEPGRLLLVVPNVLAAERELKVDPADFRLWVCLHEETHRVQFAANPWLRAHMINRTRNLTGDLLGDPGATLRRFFEGIRRLPEVASGGSTTILDLVQTPQQREEMARLTAVMSLLEGHADVVMDMVGPQVIPSVASIRAKFTARRKGRGLFDQVFRRMLGLEAKMRQYADGAGFVQGVIDKVGMDGFNQVWQGPDTLPLPTEIHNPAAWVERVHR